MAPQYSGTSYERYRHAKPLLQLRLLPQPDGKASIIISELRLNYDDQCRLSTVSERGQSIRWSHRVVQQTLQDSGLCIIILTARRTTVHPLSKSVQDP
ncbi:MAG: hypothetical protein GPOALKHO_000918 [Sodalis sp.]|uniref:hypothetical protein n=1 Tax=Sodalis sp. (in: enterobacteria) TaxID=1898979 RepID=UPI00387309DD|nr:MAG: hypothetical protein GPOALKHO_000918 [Sodalis sp.]